ncbi:MAG TPA: hypothetical protein VIM19_09495 [Actinomycetes bacterium]
MGRGSRRDRGERREPSGWLWVGWISATSLNGTPVLLALGPASAVDGYLAGTSYAVTDRWTSATAEVTEVRGHRPPADPTSQPFWVHSATGHTAVRLDIGPDAGSYRVVVVNQDGSSGVACSR